MKLFSLIIVLFVLVTTAFSQNEEYSGNLVLYPTFDHFERDSGVVYQGNFESVGAMFFFGRQSHTFKIIRSERIDSLQHKVRVKYKDIWGFKWGNALYRISPFDELMYVAYSGDIHYYEICDYRHIIDIVTPSTDVGDINKALSTSLVSETLNSSLYVVKNRKKFRKKRSPQVDTLLLKINGGQVVIDCLSEATDNSEIRNCFLQLDKEEQPR